MKLYIRFGSLARFQTLYDGNEFLRRVLSQTSSNVYGIETDDSEKVAEIVRVLTANRVNHEISDE